MRRRAWDHSRVVALVWQGAVFVIASIFIVPGCTGPREVPERYRASAADASSPTTERQERGASDEDDASPRAASEAGPSKAAPEFRTVRELPLEGNVRFTLLGGCRGCSGGELTAEAEVSGDEILITGEVSGCEGSCAAYRPATGSVLLRRLRPKTYTVRSKLRVTKVSPLSLGAKKRADWALFLMGESCEEGLEGLTGNERTSDEFLSKVGECLAKVRPEVRRETFSSMLGWKNNQAFVPHLIEGLRDKKVGYLAARVLGRIEDERAVGPLIEALGAGDKSLRWDAARSLEMITEQNFGEDQTRWKAWQAQRAR